MSGEQIAAEATRYLAAVDAMRAEGHDPHAHARARKAPPLDPETIYSEAAFVSLERRGLPIFPPAPWLETGHECDGCGAPTAGPVPRCWRCV
jgi:hypothetical protein